jgi:hypothetical protein
MICAKRWPGSRFPGERAFEDLTVPNDRPVREVAAGIVDWLGWM